MLDLELACLAASDLPADEAIALSLPEFAAEVLRKRWKKLVNAGQALDEMDDTALHGLRLKAKRLRYAAEFFAPLFPEKPTSRFIRGLTVLQERLGQFNDTTVAEKLLRDLSGKPGYAAGLVLGFTAARGLRARPKIATAWTRFRRRDPFWV
jgi:triphosphatase